MYTVYPQNPILYFFISFILSWMSLGPGILCNAGHQAKDYWAAHKANVLQVESISKSDASFIMHVSWAFCPSVNLNSAHTTEHSHFQTTSCGMTRAP